MRVALVGPVFPYRGGIAHYTTSLASALRDQDHQLLLISFSRQYPSWLYPGNTDKDPSTKPFTVADVRYWIDCRGALFRPSSHGNMAGSLPEEVQASLGALFERNCVLPSICARSLG